LSPPRVCFAAPLALPTATRRPEPFRPVLMVRTLVPR
jgi:hypothetical protein